MARRCCSSTRGRRERELEAIPWVEDARVTTHFPHRATIEIRERTPVATYQGADGEYRVLDRDGRVLDVLDGHPIAILLITGRSLDFDPVSSRPQAYNAARQLAIALTAEVRATVDRSPSTADGCD